MKETVGLGVIIKQAGLGKKECHGTAALVHNPDAERQIVIGKSSGAMAPRFHFDGDGHAGQPSGDGLLCLIGLVGWVGQGPKPGGSAGLKHQQERE
jgi:hypothetical protein